MNLAEIRTEISELRRAPESNVVHDLIASVSASAEERRNFSAKAGTLVTELRSGSNAGLMELFLAEYGLSTNEGIALMTLAEAYLRTPDDASLDELIQDKIGSGDWQSHTGNANSALINASTWALLLTGRVVGEDEFGESELLGAIHGMIRRLGEPVVRKAVEQSMKFLGSQFVFGRSIDEALRNAAADDYRGNTFSFDMLGEAARTADDARRYFRSYSEAILAIGNCARGDGTSNRHGISVKLSALYARYEWVQRENVLSELVPLLTSLANMAKANQIALTVDAEEANRLELSLDVIETALRSPSLRGWDGFGIAVQAYSKQAPAVIDWFHALAGELDTPVTLRLVKGAYWDSEIKYAQQFGLDNYPVFTRKEHTDISYLACARNLLSMRGRIYPQFATHNALTMATILGMTDDMTGFEFQRLHGMGEALHKIIGRHSEVSTRIYAPVGVHKDLLAYLVRRLLENGANSSFVNQLLDENVTVETLVADPIDKVVGQSATPNPHIPLPAEIFGEARINSRGLDVNDPASADALAEAMEPFRETKWRCNPDHLHQIADEHRVEVRCPANDADIVGSIPFAQSDHMDEMVARSSAAFEEWNGVGVEARAQVLERMAVLLEDNAAELIAMTTREAGKSRLDGILEVREAVDFCRYYAAEARKLLGDRSLQPRGPVVCISPWNFPLAIFVGQISAALVAGNSVIAKPAEQTPLIAWRAAQLFHHAGVPDDALICVPGKGGEIGHALTAHPDIQGVCFTGSTATARIIDRNLAENGNPLAFLIAETGGLNAMIVDSTALPEQAVRDIVSSAFQSAGQRCSALRVLFVQNDIEAEIIGMLSGAASELRITDPWDISCDVGPVIDRAAREKIVNHCEELTGQGRLIFRMDPAEDLSAQGTFVAPSAFRLESLDQLEEEIFGPVLHVVTFKADELDSVVDQINRSGYGLTLGVHSRINSRVDRICARANVGNIYVNRNQIGAVVGVQPFGGMGLSGTGPKAGGPLYLRRFVNSGGTATDQPAEDTVKPIVLEPAQDSVQAGIDIPDLSTWQHSENRAALLSDFARHLPSDLRPIANDALSAAADVNGSPVNLPSPTGESNAYLMLGRGGILCLGSEDRGEQAAVQQVVTALAAGCGVVLPKILFPEIEEPFLFAAQRSSVPMELIQFVEEMPASLIQSDAIAAVAFSGGTDSVRELRRRIARRDRARVVHIQSASEIELFVTEKLISTDTTASGGNASLMMTAG